MHRLAFFRMTKEKPDRDDPSQISFWRNRNTVVILSKLQVKSAELLKTKILTA